MAAVLTDDFDAVVYVHFTMIAFETRRTSAIIIACIVELIACGVVGAPVLVRLAWSFVALTIRALVADYTAACVFVIHMGIEYAC